MNKPIIIPPGAQTSAVNMLGDISRQLPKVPPKVKDPNTKKPKRLGTAKRTDVRRFGGK